MPKLFDSILRIHRRIQTIFILHNMSLKICETSWFKVLKDNDSNIKPHGKWLNISFNRKRDHFAVATSTGLLVYKCSGKAKLIYYHGPVQLLVARFLKYELV